MVYATLGSKVIMFAVSAIFEMSSAIVNYRHYNGYFCVAIHRLGTQWNRANPKSC